MRHIARSLLVLILLLAVVVTQPGNALAEEISVTQELHVTAKVLPKQRIIVDRRGAIIEITSNTSEEVTPEVFLLREADANRQPLTPAIYTEYRKYVPEDSEKAGVLYRRGLTLAFLLRP